MDQRTRDQRIREVASGVKREPPHPTARCPRCDGPWFRREMAQNDYSRYAYIWHCLYCGETHGE